MFIAWIIFYNISQSVISPQSFYSTKSFTFLYTYNLRIFHNFHYFLQPQIFKMLGSFSFCSSMHSI